MKPWTSYHLEVTMCVKIHQHLNILLLMDFTTGKNRTAVRFVSCKICLFSDINVTRPDDASNFEEQSSDHAIDESSLMSYHEEPDQPVLEPLSASNASNSYSAFPPSFSQMLTNCSIDYEQGALISEEDLH